MQNYLKLARFDRPAGFFLLLWPTAWALLIASNGRPSLKYIIVFTLGVIIMRSAGCIINDIADRNFDGLVTRTKNRPLVNGSLTVVQALGLFSIFSFIALVLALQLNLAALKLAVIAFLIALIYPFSKRFTHFPQVILGIAFSFSVLIVFAVYNQLSLVAWLLFGANLVFTVAYDSYYALADYQDDRLIGIKSTATFFNQATVSFIVGLQLVFIIICCYLGILLKYSAGYYSILLIVSLIFYYQYKLGSKKYFKAFLANNMVGLLIFIAIFFEYSNWSV